MYSRHPAWRNDVDAMIKQPFRWCIAGILTVLIVNGAYAHSLSMASKPDTLAKAALGSVPGTAVVGKWDGSKATYGTAYKDTTGSVKPFADHEQPLFEIGSISKVFTGLLLAQAVECGDLRLDDTLGKLLNGKVKLSPPVAAITLRDLVTHSSCLPRLPDDFAGQSRIKLYRDYERRGLWDALAKLKLENPPPCEADYSNFGFAVLGELLAERYNKPWELLVRERITKPLGMDDTQQQLGEKATRLVEGYSGSDPAIPWEMRAFAGAGGLRSTAADMLGFGRAILAGKGGPLGAAAQRLVTPLGTIRGDQIGYAVRILGPENKRIFFHEGITGGYRSLWMVAPDSNEALVVLASNNKAPVSNVAQAIEVSRYSVGSESVPIDPRKLSRYVGVFRVDNKKAFTFVMQDNTLYGRVTGQVFRALTPNAENTFVLAAVGAKFTFSSEGDAVTKVTLNQAGRVTTARRTDETVPGKARLTSSALEAYIGEYHEAGNSKPHLKFDVQAEGGLLAVKLNDQKRLLVFPVADHPDRFAYDTVKAELQFERDAGGKVVALVLHQNTVRRAIKLAE
jgi:serine-type D-Ala-D-Ala carboxypeptidase/endopeptidase